MGALLARKEDFYRKLYPKYFVGALFASDRLREQLRNSDKRQAVLIGEPLIDLMELTGYSIVMAELGQKGFWEVGEEHWNRYFETQGEQRTAEIIGLLYVLTEPKWTITPRQLERTKWQQAFRQFLQENGILGHDDYGSPFFPEETKPHSSPLIQLFCRSVYLSTDANTVFLGTYLARRKEATGIEKPGALRAFEEELARETKGRRRR